LLNEIALGAAGEHIFVADGFIGVGFAWGTWLELGRETAGELLIDPRGHDVHAG